jgi:hypothetical protein
MESDELFYAYVAGFFDEQRLEREGIANEIQTAALKRRM